MKWFKHISDSLDDPFIFDLCQECGPSGYYVFFGVLEMYAREFKVQDGFKLVLSLHYLCTKLAASRKQHIIKSLKFCSESGKWDVKFDGKYVEIFIPKFRKYLDEFTLKKLRQAEKKSGSTPDKLRTNSGQNPKSLPKKVATEVDVDKDSITPPSPPMGGVVKKSYQKRQKVEYSESFESWWAHYPKKVGKLAAWKEWKKIEREKTATVRQLIDAIIAQVAADHFIGQDGNDYTPDPERWFRKGRWSDEIKPKPKPHNSPQYKELTEDEIYGRCN